MSPGAPRTRAHLALLNAAALALGACFLHGEINDWGGDNVDFLLLARALFEGKGYVSLQMPDAPAHVRYPPGFPLLLTPLVGLGAPLLWIKAFVAALALAGMNLAYLALARMRDPTVALLATLAATTSCVFLDPALSVMSDGPYLLASFAALLAFDRALHDPASRWRAAAVAGALAGAAILTRTVGVLLLPGVALAALAGRSALPRVERVRRTALFAAVALLVAGPWLAHAVLADRTSTSYVAQFQRKAEPSEREGAPSAAPGISGGGSSILARPWLNARDLYGRANALPVPEALAGGRAERVVRAGFLGALTLAGVVALAGMLRAVLARRSVFDAYGLVYVVTLSFWIGGGPRLLVPILPLLIEWIGGGARACVQIVSRVSRVARGAARATRAPSSRRLELAALVAVCALSLGVTLLSPRVRRRLNGTHGGWWPSYLQTIDELAAVARPGELVLCQPNNVPYYRRGIHAARLNPKLGGVDALLEGILASGATYLIDCPFQFHEYKGRITKTVAAFPERFTPLYRNGRVALYRIERSGG